MVLYAKSNTACRYLVEPVDVEVSAVPILTQLNVNLLRSVRPGGVTFTLTRFVTSPIVGTQVITECSPSCKVSCVQ